MPSSVQRGPSTRFVRRIPARSRTEVKRVTAKAETTAAFQTTFALPPRRPARRSRATTPEATERRIQASKWNLKTVFIRSQT